MCHKQTLCAGTWLPESALLFAFAPLILLKTTCTHGAGLLLTESALFRVLAPLILFRTTCDTWCRDMAFRQSTFPCNCITDPLQNYVLVVHGAGLWLPESAPFFVFAPWILFRFTCDT